MRTALIALLALGVCLAGCGKKPLIADPKAEKKNPEPTKAIPANIVDSIVEKEIRRILKKPEGELTKANLEQVTEIDLGGTEITDAGLKEVAKLQQLTSLDLAGCEQITDAGLKEVAQHKQLISLGLPPKITGASLKGVAKLQQLTGLNLWETQITDAGLKEVAKLQKLTYLDLSCYEQITDTGVAQLQKALPK